MSVAWVGAAIAAVGVASQASAAEDAEDAQTRAANEAAGRQSGQFEQTREDQAPFREAGYRSLTRLEQLLGQGGDAGAADYGMLTRRYTGADLMADPGYQFEMQQGNQAIERAATAAGRNYSGATLKALQRFGQGLASTKFNEGFNRDRVQRNDLFNQLSGVSGTGQVATNQVNAAGQTFANNVGSLAMQGANVRAASGINQANIWSNALNQGVSEWQRRAGSGPASGATGAGYAGATNYGQYGTNADGIVMDGY
jgi:hypothetical protein